MTQEEAAILRENEEVVSYWLDAADRILATAFTEVQNFGGIPDGAAVRSNSVKWLGRFLREEAGPYVTGRRVRMSIHRATTDTLDALHFQYEFGGKTLEVLETVNFVLVRFDGQEILSFTENEKQRAITERSGQILNVIGTYLGSDLNDTEYRWTFQFPFSIKEGTRFSTNPKANPELMWSWAERLDGGIRNGKLFFLGFKVTEATSGRHFIPNGQHWFDGKCWDPISNIPVKRP